MDLAGVANAVGTSGTADAVDSQEGTTQMGLVRGGFPLVVSLYHGAPKVAGVWRSTVMCVGIHPNRLHSAMVLKVLEMFMVVIQDLLWHPVYWQETVASVQYLT